MKSNLLHNQLTDNLLNRIGVTKQPPLAQYTVDGNNFNLELEPFDDSSMSYKPDDQRLIWDPNKHNFTISRELEIAHSYLLFESGNLMDSNKEIGVALRYYSKQAHVTNTRFVDLFTATNQPTLIKYTETIEPGILRGSVKFELFLYDLDTGLNLGTIDLFEVRIDGDASIFPIEEVHQKGEPLWWIRANYSDPLIDELEYSNITIVINKGHRDAQGLEVTEGVQSSPLLVEVLSSALTLIILEVKESSEWENILNGESQEDSIGAAIHYFINTFEWDISSIPALSKSIKSFFNKNKI